MLVSNQAESEILVITLLLRLRMRSMPPLADGSVLLPSTRVHVEAQSESRPVHVSRHYGIRHDEDRSELASSASIN